MPAPFSPISNQLLLVKLDRAIKNLTAAGLTRQQISNYAFTQLIDHNRNYGINPHGILLGELNAYLNAQTPTLPVISGNEDDAPV